MLGFGQGVEDLHRKDQVTLSAVGCRRAYKVWELDLGRDGLADHGCWLATGDVAAQGPSFLVEDREGPVHVHLVEGEA